jgi:hypothetical protein
MTIIVINPIKQFDQIFEVPDKGSVMTGIRDAGLQARQSHDLGINRDHVHMLIAIPRQLCASREVQFEGEEFA